MVGRGLGMGLGRKEKKLILKWISYAVLSTNCHKVRKDTATWVFYLVVLRWIFFFYLLHLLRCCCCCPTANYAKPFGNWTHDSMSQIYSYTCSALPPPLTRCIPSPATFIHYDIGQHKTCKSWKWPCALANPLGPYPPALDSYNKTGKTWKTNKTKVSSYFGLFCSFIYFLLPFLPFYVKSPQRAVGRGMHWVQGDAGGCTHVSFVVRTNKHGRRTIRNLRKKAKVEVEVARKRRSSCLSPYALPSPPTPVQPVVCCSDSWFAKLMKLLYVYLRFTFTYGTTLPSLSHSALRLAHFLCRPFGQFLRLSLCYSDALSLQDLHTMWLGKTFTQLHMLD